jgi:hypothetical protein
VAVKSIIDRQASVQTASNDIGSDRQASADSTYTDWQLYAPAMVAIRHDPRIQKAFVVITKSLRRY